MAGAVAHPLAERLERAVAQNLRDFVEVAQWVAPQLDSDAMWCGHGVAAFMGSDSPLTTVKGIGADPTDEQLDEAEAFFEALGGERTVVELTPWSSEATGRRLTDRGYRIVDHEDVVVRADPSSAPPSLSSERLDLESWPDVQLLVNEDPVTPEWRALATVCAHLPDAVGLGARQDGTWVGCAQLVPAAGVAILGNDATHPDARGRGTQAALIRARLRVAEALGFGLVMAEVAPGSTSERNYLRCGFDLAYTRVHWARQNIA